MAAGSTDETKWPWMCMVRAQHANYLLDELVDDCAAAAAAALICATRAVQYFAIFFSSRARYFAFDAIRSHACLTARSAEGARCFLHHACTSAAAASVEN